MEAEELVRGAVELHTHSAPSRFPRCADDWELVEEASAAGMRALVIKAHEFSTVERAYLLRRRIRGIEVFGGIVLNHSVGGFNPAAVEMALTLGARIVWLPTTSSAHHQAFFQSIGKAFLSAGALRYESPGLQILDSRGRLRSEVEEIMELVRARDAILATGHLSPQEVRLVARAFLTRQHARLLVTHPDLNISSIPLEMQIELAQRGAFLEKCALALEPDWGERPIAEMAQSIRAIGPEHCVLVTDAGAAGMPAAPARLRHFVSQLLQAGVQEADIRRMAAHNPAQLLGLA